MSDDTGNAGRKRPMGIMLISMLHILAGVFIFAYLLFTLIKFSDVFFLDTQPIILLTLGGAMVLMAICLLISSYGLWKNMGETFCYRVSYYINTRQHSGPGDFGLCGCYINNHK